MSGPRESFRAENGGREGQGVSHRGTLGDDIGNADIVNSLGDRINPLLICTGN